MNKLPPGASDPEPHNSWNWGRIGFVAVILILLVATGALIVLALFGPSYCCIYSNIVNSL